MANHNLAVRGGSLADMRYPEWWRKGWLDALAGREFCPEYENALRLQQVQYECGRLIACAVKQHEPNPPAWRKAEKVPKALNELVLKVLQRYGNVIPTVY